MARKMLSVMLLGGIIMSILSGCGGAKYNVDYNGQKDSFKGAKDSYRAGANVTLYFDLIATDTDYKFYVDGEQINPDYNERKGYIITFTMPEHDITVSYSSSNSMIYQPSDKEATISFDSFDGGGPEYTVKIDDESIVQYTQSSKYSNPNHAEMDGSGYTVNIIFVGIKPGKTTATVEARSPIADNFDAIYDITVDSDLKVTATERERVEKEQ